MRGDEYDRIRKKRNGLQYDNMIWDGTETGLTYSTKIIKDVDQQLEALEIVYCTENVAVEVLVDCPEDVLAQ